MWRSRRRQNAAANAIATVVHDSVLFIRAMAHNRDDSMCDDVFPGFDHCEQIRELADVCDNLVSGLRPNGVRRPIDTLQFTWDSRSEAQQQWIRRCLAGRGIRVDKLINTAPDRQRVQPN